MNSVGHQSGVVLVTALVMLLILTLLGMSGTHMIVLHTRMAHNVHQMHQAFQAAEAALRDGEAEIAHHIDQQTVFTAECDRGLCASSLGATPWNSPQVDWHTGQNTILYGSRTGALALPHITPAPRYIIEHLAIPNDEAQEAATDQRWYRVTAVSYTRRGAIQHILQSTYRQ